MSNNTVETLNDKHLRLWGIPIIVLAAILALMPFFYPGRWDLFVYYLLAGLVYASLTWELCRWALIRIRRRLPGLENTGKRVVQSSLAFLLITGVGQLVLNGLFYRYGLTPPELTNNTFVEMWLVNFASALFFVLLNSSIYEASYFFSQYKLAIQKTEQLQKWQVQQQLDTLKNRVNPHFLFNSLTTLSALIGEDAPRAERFVDELSKVYRYLLRAGRQPVATLGEELQFAESYAFLLKNRFETGAFSLRFISTDLKSPVESKTLLNYTIPVLSLQNALDFLVRTQNTPLHILMEIAGAHLCVSCDDLPKSRAFDATATDWEMLARHGADQQINSGRFSLLIPLTISNNLS